MCSTVTGSDDPFTMASLRARLLRTLGNRYRTAENYPLRRSRGLGGTREIDPHARTAPVKLDPVKLVRSMMALLMSAPS